MFTPTMIDHEKTITCRADNPSVQAGVEEDTWKLNVFCKLAANFSDTRSCVARAPASRRKLLPGCAPRQIYKVVLSLTLSLAPAFSLASEEALPKKNNFCHFRKT
jgi:hypothetical protein